MSPDTSAGGLSRVQIVVTLITVLVGGVSGSLFGVLYSEPFKAEADLRRFALTELYQPMRAKAIECRGLRRDIASAYGSAYFLVNITRSAFARFAPQAGRPGFAVSPQDVEPFAKQFGEANAKANDASHRLSACVDELGNLRLELATVLGLNQQLSEVLIKHKQVRLDELIPVDPESNKLGEYLFEPDKLMSYIQSIVDGAEGDAVRGTSALARTREIFEGAVRGYESAMERQYELLSWMAQEDADVNLMFLRDFRVRFGRTPTSYFY